MSDRLDIESFLEHVGWVSRWLPDRSRLGVLTWLGSRMEEEARHRLAKLLPIDHPIQRNAEDGIVALLGRKLEQHALRYRRREIPDRNVDWCKTYVTETSRPLSMYWTRERHSIPDTGILGGLLALSFTCINLLSLHETPDRSARRQKIAKAIRGIGAGGVRLGPFTQQHEQRLSWLDPAAREAVGVIRAWRNFHQDAFGGDDDREALRNLATMVEQSDVNINTLLEVTATLSIARAAIEAEPEDRLLEQAWQMSPLPNMKSNCPPIEVCAGELTCNISKGRPKNNAGNVADTLSHVLQQMGYGSLGNQPDIVLRFRRRGCPNQIVVLADAKRNKKLGASGDARDYIRESVEVAAAYIVSYGHAMGLQIHPGDRAEISGRVLPAVTLFCRQDVKAIAGVEITNESEVVARLRNQEPLPAIMALDLEQHFGVQKGKAWRSPVLSAWFGAIARQAWTALGAGAG